MDTHSFPFDTIKALLTRFLCPFFFHRHSVHEALKALQDVRLEGRDSPGLALWEQAKPHDLYEEEVLDHVVGFLFPSPDHAGCGYLRLSGPVANRWFNNMQARLSKDVTLPLRLSNAARLELFLSNYGVGVLSIALEPDWHDLHLPEAIEFNYRLSQLRWSNGGEFHMLHPSEDAHRWAQLSPEVKQKIPPAPDHKAPLEERLGNIGGTFTPHELIEELLRPLQDFGLRQVQDRLSVYTVARCSAEVDFERPEVRAACGPLLAALTQVEEKTHAGAPADNIGVTHAILNRRHWAGVGLLGAAHLIADQYPPEDAFNSQRPLRIFLKYFIAYLVAVLQRLTLH